MICPQPRETIEQSHIPSSKMLNTEPKSCDHDSDAEIREQDIVSVLRLEIRPIAPEIEMRAFPPGLCSHSWESEVVDD